MSLEYDAIKDKNLKNTKQRCAVLDILSESTQPSCAEDIYDELKKRNFSVSLSTVYRTLETLTEKEIALKINLGDDGKALYELNRDIHKHYLICLGCKKIISIMSCPLESYEEKLAAETGFSIEGHRLSIYGYCPKCRENIHKAETKSL